MFASECGTKLPLLSLVLTIDGAFKMQLNLTCYKFSHGGSNLNDWLTTLTNCLIGVIQAFIRQKCDNSITSKNCDPYSIEISGLV